MELMCKKPEPRAQLQTTARLLRGPGCNTRRRRRNTLFLPAPVIRQNPNQRARPTTEKNAADYILIHTKPAADAHIQTHTHTLITSSLLLLSPHPWYRLHGEATLIGDQCFWAQGGEGVRELNL